jgi:hypothetical protein
MSQDCVVDASVGVKLFVEEEDSKGIEARSRHENGQNGPDP